MEHANTPNMPDSTRTQIIALAKVHGWQPHLKDEKDRYFKLVTLRKNKQVVCIDKYTGISKNGTLKYLKVAVHPEEFDSALLIEDEIQELINSREKRNFFRHQGYQSFQHDQSDREPGAMAYKVCGLDALDRFLSQFCSNSGDRSSTPVERLS